MRRVDSRRGRSMLLVQRANSRLGLPPLGAPPSLLGMAERLAWLDIARESPLPLTTLDALWIETCALQLALWRGGVRDPSRMRELYRWLGQGLISLRRRRALLFPEATDEPA